MNLEALCGGGKNVPDGRDYKCEDKRIPSGKGVLMERTDPVRGGEVWLLTVCVMRKNRRQARVETERNSKRLLQTPR